MAAASGHILLFRLVFVSFYRPHQLEHRVTAFVVQVTIDAPAAPLDRRDRRARRLSAFPIAYMDSKQNGTVWPEAFAGHAAMGHERDPVNEVAYRGGRTGDDQVVKVVNCQKSSYGCAGMRCDIRPRICPRHWSRCVMSHRCAATQARICAIP